MSYDNESRIIDLIVRFLSIILDEFKFLYLLSIGTIDRFINFQLSNFTDEKKKGENERLPS